MIGQTDEDTGQAICAFVTLQGEDDEGSEELEAEIREHVAARIGKLARPKRIIWAYDLPKTRSGKIMRRLLRDIGEGRELGDVTTLRDPDVVSKLDEIVKQRSTRRRLAPAQPGAPDLPLEVRGSASVNSMIRGNLYGAVAALTCSWSSLRPARPTARRRR